MASSGGIDAVNTTANLNLRQKMNVINRILLQLYSLY